MERNDIKKANRKAMPGFLLITLVGAIVGGIVGFYSAEYDVEQLAGSMKSAGAFVVCLIWIVNQCVYCRAAAKCSKVL